MGWVGGVCIVKLLVDFNSLLAKVFPRGAKILNGIFIYGKYKLQSDPTAMSLFHGR